MYLSETNEISFSERNVFITPKVSESEKKFARSNKKNYICNENTKDD